MEDNIKKLVEHVGEVYIMFVGRNHYTEVVKNLCEEFDLIKKRVNEFKENGYSEKDLEEFGRIHAMLDRIESAYWEDCKDGNKPWRTPSHEPEIDWWSVLENQKDYLRDAMKMEIQCLPDDERNPYTFQVFDLQERIGLIEQGRYDEAYQLLKEEYGEEYFDDFLL